GRAAVEIVVGVGGDVTQPVGLGQDVPNRVVGVADGAAFTIRLRDNPVEGVVREGRANTADHALPQVAGEVISHRGQAVLRIVDAHDALVAIVVGRDGHAHGIGLNDAQAAIDVAVVPGARQVAGVGFHRLLHETAHLVVGKTNHVPEWGDHPDPRARVVILMTGDCDKRCVGGAGGGTGFDQEVAVVVHVLGPAAERIDLGGGVADQVVLPAGRRDARAGLGSDLLVHPDPATQPVV